MAAAKFRDIAAQLRAQIEAGELAIGDKLPTEQALVDQYRISRTTARQAVQDLRDAGLVEVRHGVGAFVAPPRTVRRLDSRERLSKARRDRNEAAFLAEAAEQSFTPSSSIRVWFEPAGDLADTLGLDPTAEVCVRDRVMRADGQPVMLATSRLPRDITRTTALEDVDTGSGGAFARLAELGHEPTAHEEIVRARNPDDAERQALDLPAGPVLCVERRTYSHGRCVEVNTMIMAAPRYELRYAWDAD